VEVIRIDLPLFYSPTGAFGHFSGEIEVSYLPRPNEPFPWPESWLKNHEVLLKEQSNQVWSINPCKDSPARPHVAMFGIVCSGREEAGLLSKHIERVSGIAFWGHETTAPSDDT
jgi:hypothetical protein